MVVDAFISIAGYQFAHFLTVDHVVGKAEVNGAYFIEAGYVFFFKRVVKTLEIILDLG